MYITSREFSFKGNVRKTKLDCKKIIRCINTIKANPKTERLFRKFCEDCSSEYVTLISHTEVRWLSKANSFKRFMLLFDEINEFLKDNNDIKELNNSKNKCLINYLADIFEKLGVLNKKLKGKSRTIIESKASIIGFIETIEVSIKHIEADNYSLFPWLSKCNVDHDTKILILQHLNTLVNELKYRFSDLYSLTIPFWVTHPFETQLFTVKNEFLDELSKLKNDISCQNIFENSRLLMWIREEVKIKYLTLTNLAQKLLIYFPLSYLVE